MATKALLMLLYLFEPACLALGTEQNEFSLSFGTPKENPKYVSAQPGYVSTYGSEPIQFTGFERLRPDDPVTCNFDNPQDGTDEDTLVIQ